MYGKCKNCVKQLNCHKPTGYKFGFCETDFEPKEKPSEPADIGMEWKQLSSTVWEAEGKYGKFRIERSCNKFWSHYASSDTAFKLPPKSKLTDAKQMCEDNEYWEVAA